MTDHIEGKKKRGLTPVDMSELLEGLQLGIGQAATLCGVSVRQLSYWTDKGIVQPVDEDRSRTYDYGAVEKVCLIKQGLDQGYSLDGAVQEAEAFLRRLEDERRRIERLSDSELEQLILQQANQLQQLAERIRREIRTYRVSGDLGTVVASLSGVERLIGFFEGNPYTVNTARQIALRVGREVTEVETELDLLEQKKFIQKISYPGADVYRYIPQRRH
jgi:DNA-binding transcriptional MerR regulator